MSLDIKSSSVPHVCADAFIKYWVQSDRILILLNVLFSLKVPIDLWNKLFGFEIKKKLLACGRKNVLLQMESSFFANYTLISFLTGDEDIWVLWWLSPLCISCTLYHGKHYVLFCCEVRINWYQANENSIDVDRLLTIFDMKSKVRT